MVKELYGISILLNYFKDIKVSKSIPNSIEYRSDLFYLMDKVSMTFSTISFEIDTQKSNDTGLLIVLRCASLLDSFTNITDEIIYSIDSMVIIMLILNKVMKYITQDVITDKESDQTKAFDRERVKFLSTKSDEIIQEMETHIKQYRKLWQSQKIFEKILE